MRSKCQGQWSGRSGFIETIWQKSRGMSISHLSFWSWSKGATTPWRDSVDQGLVPVRFHFSKSRKFSQQIRKLKHSSLTFQLLTKLENMNVKVRLDEGGFPQTELRWCPAGRGADWGKFFCQNIPLCLRPVQKKKNLSILALYVSIAYTMYPFSVPIYIFHVWFTIYIVNL